jgi:mannose-6-phosphate isomerase-like protein (cupin superfamily)
MKTPQETEQKKKKRERERKAQRVSSNKGKVNILREGKHFGFKNPF